MSAAPTKAMVLAAGLGTRMRPLTETTPKPLIEIAGRSLLDRALDTLVEVGVNEAVVNIHHLGGQIIDHLALRDDVQITISDEREHLLDSAGGIVRALPHLGTSPFFILNADTFWIDRREPSLAAMANSWDDAAMDMMMLLADPKNATGHSGGVDFARDRNHRLRRAIGASTGDIYAGAALVHPRIFAGQKAEPHSLNLYFDRLIDSGRLFGSILDGDWITVGTPDAIAPAENALHRAEAAGAATS